MAQPLEDRMDAEMDALKYPVGPCCYRPAATAEERRRWIDEVAECPAKLRAAVTGLSAGQLDTAYRPGGWTVRQVVHHLPDSHMNGYVRFKLALTEHEPTITPYNEAEWARLPDTSAAPIEVSLQLLESLHVRWVALLGAMTEAGFARRFHHPESGTMSLETYLGGYAWHCRHHVAHITGLRSRMGW